MAMNIEEIFVSLEHAVDDGLYFEINSEDAKTLLDHIRSLESAANDDRGIL